MENLFQQQCQVNEMFNHMTAASLACIAEAEAAASRAVEDARRCGSEGVQFNQDSIQARVEFEADYNRIKSAIEAARATDAVERATGFKKLSPKYKLDPHFMG